jgi:hypothetical protein
MGKWGMQLATPITYKSLNTVETSLDPTMLLEAPSKHSINIQKISGVKFSNANYTLSRGQEM